MKTKTKALRHYDRMIKWAEKQEPREKLTNRFYDYIGMDKMGGAIGETWWGGSCEYCILYGGHKECGGCQLSKGGITIQCCNGLWDKMNGSKTWGTWVKRAKLVRQYIKDNG